MKNNILKGSDVTQVNSMAYGLLEFLKRNTGDTYDATHDHYVLNDQGVLSNNRHFIADTRMQAQPNGDATTEGQSLLILGLLHMYRGSNRQESTYLDLAKKYWDSYVEHFYGGKSIPTTPQRWVCNWIVNGKEPVLSNYPIDWDYPTHSGFKGVELEFTEGQCTIPHGEPYFGEYLDIAFFAFDGHLAYDSCVARVQAYKADGVTVDWTKAGTKYEIDWLVDLKRRKINSDGEIIAEIAEEEKGTVQLKDHTINGVHKLNFSPRVPVEFGGRYIQRNECQHNRPLHVPVTKNNYGNASDAEQWFLEASKILFDETHEDKYYKAWKASEYTVLEYTDIDRNDKFFRTTLGTTTPFTDGIAYDYTYAIHSGDTPNVKYDRTDKGYISIHSSVGSKHTLEQKAINFKVNTDSELYVEYGGGTETDLISWKINVELTDTREFKDPRSYCVVLPTTNSNQINTISIPMSSLCPLDDATSSSKVVTENIISTWGGAAVESILTENVYSSRSALIARVDMSTDGGYSVGSWDANKNFKIDSIIYRSNTYTNLRFTDDNGWKWYFLLEPTNSMWVKKTLTLSNAKLRYSQDNEGERPLVPTLTDVSEVTFVLEDSKYAYNGAYIEVYCFNDPPKLINFDDGKYISTASITCSCDREYAAYLGDFTVKDYIKNTLKYTPGVIPYSNIYQSDSYQFDSWRGLPYTGYQYPSIYYRCDDENKEQLLNNMIEFMYQAQVAYKNKFGLNGPVMQAYIWNRWDNLEYGDSDTFTMQNWGEEAWSGYEPRAFYSGANCWLDLVRTQQTVPEKLITYTENWIKWLISYYNAHKLTPTYFPMNRQPYPLENDFTGHMTGLWLAGCCSAYMAGCRVEGLQELIEGCVKELHDNYIVLDSNHVMNGCWSPSPRASSGSDKECNGVFYGFWAGEILRGLGLYLQYKRGVKTVEQNAVNTHKDPTISRALDLSIELYDSEEEAYAHPLNYYYLKRLVILTAPVKKNNYYLEWVINNNNDNIYRNNFDTQGMNDIKIQQGKILVHFKCDHPVYPVHKYIYLK